MKVAILIDALERLLSDYIQETGKKPAGLLVGPEEYMLLCKYVSMKDSHMKDAMVESLYISEFQGMMVFLKELPGIELMIPYQEVWRYLK